MTIQELMAKIPDEIKGGHYDVTDLRPLKEAILLLEDAVSKPAPPAPAPEPTATGDSAPTATGSPPKASPASRARR